MVSHKMPKKYFTNSLLFFSKISETSVTDPCSPTPCENGGECLIADGAYLQNTNFSCKCLADFSGDLCQNQLVESCENGV